MNACCLTCNSFYHAYVVEIDDDNGASVSSQLPRWAEHAWYMSNLEATKSAVRNAQISHNEHTLHVYILYKMNTDKEIKTSLF